MEVDLGLKETPSGPQDHDVFGWFGSLVVLFRKCCYVFGALMTSGRDTHMHISQPIIRIVCKSS